MGGLSLLVNVSPEGEGGQGAGGLSGYSIAPIMTEGKLLLKSRTRRRGDGSDTLLLISRFYKTQCKAVRGSLLRKWKCLKAVF